MTRPKHSKKQIEEVLRGAERAGFIVRYPMGHWGALVCPGKCPLIWVFSTPRSADNHARTLRRLIKNCPHKQ